jgi:hypothetical protein
VIAVLCGRSQVPILKQWIEDDKDNDFAILGDWNRRIETHSATDHLWDPLDVGGDVEGPTNLVLPFPHGPPLKLTRN